MARCAATTRKGTQCDNTSVEGSKYCQTHLRQKPWRRALSFTVVGTIMLGVLGFLANIAGLLDFIGFNPLDKSLRAAAATISTPDHELFKIDGRSDPFNLTVFDAYGDSKGNLNTDLSGKVILDKK